MGQGRPRSGARRPVPDPVTADRRAVARGRRPRHPQRRVAHRQRGLGRPGRRADYRPHLVRPRTGPRRVVRSHLDGPLLADGEARTEPADPIPGHRPQPGEAVERPAGSRELAVPNPVTGDRRATVIRFGPGQIEIGFVVCIDREDGSGRNPWPARRSAPSGWGRSARWWWFGGGSSTAEGCGGRLLSCRGRISPRTGARSYCRPCDGGLSW